MLEQHKGSLTPSNKAFHHSQDAVMLEESLF
jgi:hypothetical protein